MCKYHHTKHVTQYIWIKLLYIFICLFYSVHPKVDRNEWLIYKIMFFSGSILFLFLHFISHWEVFLFLSVPPFHPSINSWPVDCCQSESRIPERFRVGPCSSGLLNIAHGEGELALSGKLDMSSLPATVYWWSQTWKSGKRPHIALYGC